MSTAIKMIGKSDFRGFENEYVLAFPQKMEEKIVHHRKAKNIQSPLNVWSESVSVRNQGFLNLKKCTLKSVRFCDGLL